MTSRQKKLIFAIVAVLIIAAIGWYMHQRFFRYGYISMEKAFYQQLEEIADEAPVAFTESLNESNTAIICKFSSVQLEGTISNFDYALVAESEDFIIVAWLWRHVTWQCSIQHIYKKEDAAMIIPLGWQGKMRDGLSSCTSFVVINNGDEPSSYDFSLLQVDVYGDDYYSKSELFRTYPLHIISSKYFSYEELGMFYNLNLYFQNNTVAGLPQDLIKIGEGIFAANISFYNYEQAYSNKTELLTEMELVLPKHIYGPLGYSYSYQE